MSQIPVIFTKIMFLLFYIQIICFSEIFLSQPILLELEAPLKICGKKILTYCILGTRGVCPSERFLDPPSYPTRLKLIKNEDILIMFLSAKPRRLYSGGNSCYFVFVFKKWLILKLNIF